MLIKIKDRVEQLAQEWGKCILANCDKGQYTLQSCFSQTLVQKRIQNDTIGINTAESFGTLRHNTRYANSAIKARHF